MLLAQRSNYHTVLARSFVSAFTPVPSILLQCPVCAHAFLTLEYLQGHMQRRHPEYSGHGRREHDVDMEKELQRLKADLQNKETELQLIKVQKVRTIGQSLCTRWVLQAVDEEKIREREETIRQLKVSTVERIPVRHERSFSRRMKFNP